MTKWKGEAASFAPNLAQLVSATGRTARALLFPASLVLGLAAGHAAAANLYWDVNNTGVGIGGTGTWDASTSSWNTTGNDVAGPFTTWNSATPDNAIFQGTAGTVTLGAPITAGGLTFNVNGYTIAGGTLTLGGATPTITAAGSTTISSVIAGTAGLTKTGAGALTLTGANTFTGGVIVSGGTLSVGSDAALGNTSNSVTLNTGTVLTATGALSASRQVVLNGNVTIGGAGVGSALFTGSGNLSAGAGVTLNNDNNDFTGTVTLNGVFIPTSRGDIYFTSVRNVGEKSSLGAGGTITFTRGDSTNIIHYTGDGDSSNRDWVMSGASIRRFYNEGTGALTLSGNFDLQQSVQFNAVSADFNLLGVLGGAGGVLFSGNAGRTITLGGANSYSGATIVSATVIAPTLADIGSNSSLGTGNSNSLIDINNGTLSYKGGAASNNRTWQFSGTANLLNDGLGGLTLTGAAQFNPGPALDVLTLGGSFTGENTLSGALTGTGSMVMDGSGTWVLSGNNSYTGTTTVANGTLRAGSATAFNQQNSVIVNGGTFDLGSYDYGFTRLDGTGGTVALGSGNLTLTLGTGVNSNYGGSITGTGGLTKVGAGTLTLTGQSTYTGATTVGGGTLALDFSPATGPTSNIISASSPLIMKGGTVKITGAAGETNVQSFGGLTITTGNNTVSATSGTGGSTTINFGNITRTGGLANFVLPTTGAMTTTGPDRVLGGWATVNGSDYAKVQGGNIVAFTAADYVNKDDASTWLANEIISDAGGAANTPYFGTVGSSVQIGGLQYTAAASSTVTVAAGQTLGVDGTIIVAPSVTGGSQTITGGMITGTLGGGVLGVQQNGGGTFTIASTIVDNTGAVGFSKAGTGKVVLSGSNTYTGATTVSQGTLSINSVANSGTASAIGAASADSSNLVIEGATLEYTGASGSTDRGFTLARSGAVTSGTITVTNAATNLTISGQVVSPDGAGLTKTGPGTLTLANTASTYTGVTTVSQGTLAVTTLANGGSPSSIGAADNASSNLVLQGAGELEYLGGTTTSNRGFTLASGGGAIDVAQGATTLTMSGVAAGAGGLTKNGAGTLVLSGTNTYTGVTTVSTGILRAGSTSAFGTGAMTVNTGATLDLANNNNTVRGLNGSGNVTVGSATLTTNGNGSFSGTIGGTGGVTVATGTQTISGCTNSYTGGTTINGTLSVGCLRNGGQASDIGASSNASANLQLIGGTLVYTGGSVTTDRGFTLGGTGTINVSNAATTLGFSGVATATSLQKTGPGTLVLSGANTYNGATYVNGGILRAGSTSAFGTSGLRMDTTGATLDLNNFNNTVTYISQLNLGITGGNITLGSATLTISDGSGGNYNGAISGSGGLVKNGASAQSLSGSASSYTGSTVINGGVLAVAKLANGGSNSSIGASTSAASNLVINGGVLRYNGIGDSTDRQFTLGPNGGGLDAYASGPGPINFTSTAPITMSGTGNRTLQLAGLSTADNSLSARIDNPASGTAGLTKSGTGTWVLKNQSSTYTGVTTISGGVLAVDKLANGGQASSIGMSANAASNLVIGTGSTLRYTGAGDTTDRLFTLSTGTSFIESSGAGAIVFSNTGSASYTGSGNRTLALGGTNTGLNTMGGTIIDGPGGVTTLAKNNSGTWVLTGNNTFTGNTVINDGNLIVGNGGTTGNAGAGNVIVANATSTLSFNRGDTFNFAGNLSGAGNIAQIGTGTTRLTSAIDSSIGGTTRVDAGMLELASNLTTGGGTTVNAGTLQIDAGNTLTTPTLAMNAGSTLNVAGTVQAAGATPVAITGDAGASTMTIANGGTLLGTGDLGGGSDIVNLSGTLNTGAGALNLGAGNDTLALNDGGVLTGAVNAGTGGETGAGDTLQVNTVSGRILDAANAAGFESLLKQGTGTLTLTGNHSYSAGTTIAQGTLQIGNGATAGALATPTVANNGTLVFNLDSNYTFSGAISGTGNLIKQGTGVTTLTGTNSYTGPTSVAGGTLLVNGNQSGATGQITVGFAGTLGGTGTIGGNVAVLGALNPGNGGNAPGPLTINGNLSLSTSSAKLNVNFGQANVPGGPLNDLINVGGNLTLDGTLNVTQSPGGTLGPGVYRIINYNGSLTDNGLDVTDSNYFVQTSVANQVNLVNSAGLTLSYWDGDAGPHSNSAVNGGSGTWRAAGDQNWTDAAGVFAAPFANGSFAIFQGAAGTVTVDGTNGPVQAAGMQFATDGYRVQGADVGLVGPQSIIRVGDGTAAGAAYVATIASNLTGAGRLVKTDAGTLILTGTNSYTGGTAINGGTLQIASNGNLGDASGGLSLDSGTLHTTANVNSTRAVTLNAGGGTFDTDGATGLILNNTVSGAGALTKEGGGTLILAGTNTYQGGTFINDGTVQITADANLGNAAGKVTFDGGTLHQSLSSIVTGRNATLAAGGGTFQTDSALQWEGTVDGTGALTKTGTGALFLGADNSYAGGTTIASGILTLGTGGTTGSILADVVDNGTLSFNRSNLYTFDGTISGSGGVSQDGTGNTVLTADNTYTGSTLIAGGGGLYIDGDQTAATGLTNVNFGTIGGNGTIGGDVFVDVAGRLAPGGLGTTPGTLTINGDLELADGSNLDYSFGQAGVVGGAYNDLTVVHGNLTLDGTINVAETPGGNFGPGIYRVISYDGALTDNGLASNSPDYSVQTSVDHQVNLINSTGLALNYWDGDAGPKTDDLVNGGDGTWRAAGDDNWTNDTGHVNAQFSDGTFAIFAGAAGTVDVDSTTNGQVQASGMQFATDGYTIQGESVELVGPQSIIRVGDGTLPGAGYTATITSVLAGDSQLVKTDLGTLVLTGINTYTGGTEIRQGTLQFSSDANLGTGPLTLDGGTLHNTVAINSARGVSLGTAGGTFETDADLTLAGAFTGAGGFTKTGAAALILNGTGDYSGPTVVSAGSLYVNGDHSGAAGPTSVANSATLGGAGTIGGDVTIADGAALDPGAADGTPGTLAIAGNLTLSGGSVLNYSLGQPNVAGGTLNDVTTVGGNLVLDGTLNVSVSPGGTFGPGVYRLFDYAGSLVNNGLTVGTIPSTSYFVQTAFANQVNLVNTAGLNLNYWDGAAGPKFDGAIEGGDGVWQSSAGNDNWAEATGGINAAYSDGAFAIFAGRAGTVSVDNSAGQVTAAGMQFMTDGYVIEGGTIALLGGPTSTIRVGDGTDAGAAITATIASQLTGNTQLVKTDKGTLVLAGNNSYTGGTAINGGTLQVSADANLGDAGGALTFGGGTLHTTASLSTTRSLNLAGQGTLLTDAGRTLTLTGALSGGGSLTKHGEGTVALGGDSSGFTGATSVNGGTLAVNGKLCGDVNVRDGGRLQGTGTVCDTNNFAGGVIAPGNSIGTLTVAGDYAGSGGTLEIEAKLGGDAAPTDRLVVTGNTSGKTDVKVINVGGGGAPTDNGIKIVDVGGTSAGSFSLVGNYLFQGEQAVVGGAYAYRLYKGGVSTPADGDWYLRSSLISPDNPGDPDPQPLYAPGVPLYEAYAGVLQSFNQLGTLQERVGNRSWGAAATPQGADVQTAPPVDGKAIWARIEAAHSEFEPKTSTTGTDYDVTTWRLQAGLDGLLSESAAGLLIGGVTVHYGTISSDISSVFGSGAINATGYGFGGTLTWYGTSGFYVDAQAEATWYDSDLKSATLGTTLADGNDGFGYALSIETGQKVALTSNWSLTPQAQLAYSAVDFDDFTDPFGAAVSLDSGDSLLGRLGLSADYEDQWVDAAGQVSRAHVYGIANLYYDFLDGSNVNVSGVNVVSENQALWGGLGLGGTLSWADGRYAVYGEALARTSLEDFGDSNSIGAKLGFSVKW